MARHYTPHGTKGRGDAQHISGHLPTHGRMRTTLTHGNVMLGTTSLASGRFVTVDIETTGSRPGSGGILELGAVLIESGRIVDRFSTLVDPGEPIPQAIRVLTGIDDEMIAEAPSVGRAIDRFRTFVGDAVLVAHNHRFDMGFLDYEAERSWGTPFPRPVLDTLALARRLHPDLERHNLRLLAEHYGVDAVPTHRALPDALATAQVLLVMFEELARAGIVTAGDAARFSGLAQHGVLARKLVLATHLPDCPGVYLFRDDAGRVTYVGRARSLRARVRSHFYASGDPGPFDPAATVARIDHITFVSDLDARLVESRLLNRYRPSYNRDHGLVRDPHYLHFSTEDPHPSVRVTRRRFARGVLLGPISSEWAARSVAATLTDRFGLRLCTGDLTRASARQCRHRGTGVCPEPCFGDVPGYRDRASAAVEVFNGQGLRFRDSLQEARDRAVRARHHEESIDYRDRIRALDRVMSALDVAKRAHSSLVSVVVEGDESAAAVIVLVHGAVFTTLRLTRERIANGGATPALSSTLARARRLAERGRPITPRQLRDTVIVDTYLQQHAPFTLRVDDRTDAVRRIDSVLRRMVRAPRRRRATS